MKEPNTSVYLVEQGFQQFKAGDLLIPGYREHMRVLWWHLTAREYGGYDLPDPRDELHITDSVILLHCRKLK